MNDVVPFKNESEAFEALEERRAGVVEHVEESLPERRHFKDENEAFDALLAEREAKEIEPAQAEPEAEIADDGEYALQLTETDLRDVNYLKQRRAEILSMGKQYAADELAFTQRYGAVDLNQLETTDHARAVQIRTDASELMGRRDKLVAEANEQERLEQQAELTLALRREGKAMLAARPALRDETVCQATIAFLAKRGLPEASTWINHRYVLLGYDLMEAQKEIAALKAKQPRKVIPRGGRKPKPAAPPAELSKPRRVGAEDSLDAVYDRWQAEKRAGVS